MDITSYAVICGGTAAIAAVVAGLAWRRRQMPGGTSLAWLMLAVTVWSASLALEYATIGTPAKVVWAKLEYIGVVSSPVLFLLLALEYNRRQTWLTRRKIALLFVIPAVTLGLAATNEWHHLIWTSFTPSPVGQNLLVYGHGAAYWIGAVGYSYLAMLAGALLFAWAALRFPPVYQRQALAVLLGALVPWAGNLIYVAGLSPAPGLELAPLLLVFSGIVIAWNIFRFGLLNLVPVARDALIETMPDGLVVLDEQGRVVDINPAARNLLAVPAAQVLGRPAFEALAVWPALSQACVALAGHVEIRLEESGPAGGPARHYDLQTTPLHNRSGALTGKLLMLRDITQRKRLEEQLRQQATTDELTRVANRRHFLEAAQSEIRRAQRLMYPLALAVIDLDHFKQINDTYGHAGGDQALVAFAKICQPLIREIDLFARIGGDEFALLLPGATGAQAGNVVERVRAALAAGPLKRDGQRVAITLSVGIACLLDGPESLEALLARADGALYQAKEAGRNRVVLAPEPPRSRRRPEAALIK